MQFAVQCAQSEEEETTGQWSRGCTTLGVGLNPPNVPVEGRARAVPGERPEGQEGHATAAEVNQGGSLEVAGCQLHPSCLSVAIRETGPTSRDFLRRSGRDRKQGSRWW